MAHAELEDAGKGAVAGRADHQTLQNAELRRVLHDADHPADGVAIHHTVSIQRQQKGIVMPPAIAEIGNIASLVAVVLDAAAIDQAFGPLGHALPCRKQRFLAGDDGRLVAVAQHKKREARPLAGCIQTFLDHMQTRKGACGVFVAQRHQDRCRQTQRLALVADIKIGRDLAQAVTGAVQQPQADHRIPETQHRPRHRQHESADNRAVHP